MVGKPITIIDQKIMKVRTRDFDNSEHKKSRRESFLQGTHMQI